VKILITALADLSQAKGSTVHLLELVQRLRDAGHEVRLLVSDYGRPDRPVEGVVFIPVRSLKVRGLRYLTGLLTFQASLLLRLIAAARTDRPDVIYARHDAFLIMPALFCAIWRVPMVAEINGVLSFELTLRGHGRAGIFINRIVERFAYRRARSVVAVSEGVKAHLLEDLRVPASRVVVSPNGADIEAFVPVRGGGGEAEAPVFGYVGGLQPYQGVDRILEALAVLKQRGCRFRFVVVGDGPERMRLEALASRLGLAEDVWFVGRVAHQEVPDAVRGMDLCVLSKVPRAQGVTFPHSSSPVKAFEYMAAGKPIVSSDMDDFRFIAEAGAGILADVLDAEAFADALWKVASDKDLARSMGEAGRRFAEREGSWERSAARVEAACREAIAS